MRKVGIPRPLAERFWEKVDKNGPVLRPELGPCWIWTASLTRDGYGLIGAGGPGPTPNLRRAHRVAWELEHGAIPDEQQVCHRCDNRACVRHDHLFLGTNLENQADAKRKGRTRRGERQNKARLTESDVREIRQRYAEDSGWISVRLLARRFGVTPPQILKVARRQQWAHVE